MPLPRGALRSAAHLRFEGDDGGARPVQSRFLDLWPDGSIRWLLLDFTASLSNGVLPQTALCWGDSPPETSLKQVLHIRETPDGVEIDTGAAMFTFLKGAAFPFSGVQDSRGPIIDIAASGLQVGLFGRTVEFSVSTVEVRERGPLRAELVVQSAFGGDRPVPLHVSARVELFAGMATARIAITIRNPQRAKHAGGQWVLGDPGSVLIDFASLILALPHDVTRTAIATETGSPLEPAEMPVEIYQDSSGGDAWDHRTHVNRHGVVPAKFRGYRVRSAAGERAGLRSSPVVSVGAGRLQVAVAVPEFWQNFPRAVTIDRRAIELGFFPRQSNDRHELQGGEQKTHAAVIAFGPDAVSDPPLAWCHDPLRVYPSPEWCCDTGAVALLGPASSDAESYRRLVELALDGEAGFATKRERFDEYGWRHFGDMPGDHESAFQPPDRPFVSHYNNQYDAVAAFAEHFLRSGDVRWWRLMDDLARHVRDIDVYRTSDDKAAYNGGLFWHTQHYMDAGTSTHRTYPKGSGGGGPSAEHNYTGGLMLHYFMTGDRASRDTAIDLARWVIEMDDGRKTPLRWLASGPTGLASATGSMSYHGPGRGPANSIVACLVANRLSGDRAFAAKADELIRRCVHPADDLGARNLLDVERRWYYTVFLQALGVYLHEKAERGELDAMYAYARDSLLHYARWMAIHEVPYLSRPEVLEYATETWPAQDLRKAEVFWWASQHAEAGERGRFAARGHFFFSHSVEVLNGLPTRHFTRPLVLILRNGARAGVFSASSTVLPAPAVKTSGAVPAPHRFTPQKQRALQRIFVAAVVGITVTALLALFLIFAA